VNDKRASRCHWRLVWSGKTAWWSTDPHPRETRCLLALGHRGHCWLGAKVRT